jgi:drug/metabolite transporter (DMT)-like permease
MVILKILLLIVLLGIVVTFLPWALWNMMASLTGEKEISFTSYIKSINKSDKG